MKNTFEIRGNVTAIYINSPKYGNIEALIDTSDFTKADSFPNSWHAMFSKSTNSFYVVGKRFSKGIEKTILLHRWITNAPDGMVVDHKDFNGLVNTGDNLRVCTELENAQNKKNTCKNNKSGFRGVSWSKRSEKWKASMQIQKKQKHLGYFDAIEEADKAVKKARKEHMPYSAEASEEIA